jgi:hypothetical protein
VPDADDDISGELLVGELDLDRMRAQRVDALDVVLDPRLHIEHRLRRVLEPRVEGMRRPYDHVHVVERLDLRRLGQCAGAEGVGARDVRAHVLLEGRL